MSASSSYHVLGGTVKPAIPHPSAFLLLSAQPFLPPTSDQVLSLPLQASFIILTHDRTCTRKTAGSGHADPLLSHAKYFKPIWSLPSWNYFADVSSCLVDTHTIQANKHPTSTPFPGSRQCHSCTELIPGRRRGSPAEAASAAQCSGEDRQGN